jgi:cytochrome P450
MPESHTRTSDWTPGAVAPPFPEYERLRAKCPVAYSASFGGFFSLFKHEDVVAASRDWKNFSSAKGSPFIELPAMPLAIPLSTDPPAHGPYRKLLNKYFMPDRLAELEPQIQQFVDEYVGDLLGGGSGDASHLAARLPHRVLVALLNMPDETHAMLMQKSAQIHESIDDVDALNEMVGNLFTLEVIELVNSRKAHPLDPQKDLMSGVVNAEINGFPVSFEDSVAIGVMLFAAGGDTTTAAIANCLHHLATCPEDQAQLRGQPEMIPSAIEEFLRLRPPLHYMARTTTTDVVIGGEMLPSGTRVGLNFASANRDVDVFEDANTCVLNRKPNRHVTFGSGPHTCLGAPLARLELKLVIEAILMRTRFFELDGDPVERVEPPFASGFWSLPLKFTT